MIKRMVVKSADQQLGKILNEFHYLYIMKLIYLSHFKGNSIFSQGNESLSFSIVCLTR